MIIHLLIDEFFQFFIAFNSFCNVIIEDKKLLSEEKFVSFIHSITVQWTGIVQPLHCIMLQ